MGEINENETKRGKGTAQREIKSKSNSEVELPGAANNPTGAEEMR